MAESGSASTAKSRWGDPLISLLTVLGDAFAIEGAFLFSYWLRFHSTLLESLDDPTETPPPLGNYLLASAFVIVVWLILFQTRRMYRARRSVTMSDEIVNVGKVVTLGMLMVLSAAFFYREFSYSRAVFTLIWVTAILFIALVRASVLWFERRQYRRGKHLRQAVILGNDARADEIFERLHKHASFGFHILGYFADLPAPAAGSLSRTQHLGAIPSASSYIRSRRVDLTFVALRADQHALLLDVLGECEGMNIDFLMVPDVLEVLTSRVRLNELEGIPLLRLKSIPFTLWGRASKRTLDIVVSLVLLLVLSPFLLLIMLLIKLDSPGPVFYRQERVGLDGRKFTMIKFRSMRVDADLETARPVLGIKDDPRRTHIGVWLRKASLDEIPQLINVLKGEMSLVGPRPERPVLVEEFRRVVPKYLDRHRVKTGMTGWAQVNGFRGNTSIEDRVKYDLYYIENWSLAFDFKILLRTLRASLNMKDVH
jgi:exopolysaccharide biosynthesis polyprenyl glycosylphosphotransferase